MEFNSLPLLFFINSIHHFFSKLSYICSHPLFSTYVTLYTLILLYAPSLFLSIVLSPIFNSTAIILISLLRLGANETSGNELIVQESKFHNSIANERSEKEFDYLEPRVLDHKNNQYKRGSIDDLDLVQELSSLEPRFLDFVDQTRTHVECKAKEDSCQEYTQNHANSKPISSYSDQQSNQMHVEFDHDLCLGSNSHDDYHKWEFLDTSSMESSQVNEEEETRMEVSKRVYTTMKLLEWNMKGPLEVIYEAYEGEEEDDQESNENRKISSDKNVVRSCDRYPTLSMYYPESETDSSSDDDILINENWETQESVLFKWEDEYEDEDKDDREELIEISLDRYGKRSIEFCHVEEDNLIEIDIFPTKN